MKICRYEPRDAPPVATTARRRPRPVTPMTSAELDPSPDEVLDVVSGPFERRIAAGRRRRP